MTKLGKFVAACAAVLGAFEVAAYTSRSYVQDGLIAHWDACENAGVMVSLPDLWLEPRFLYERDVVRDNGTYLNLALGHTFALVDGRTLTAEF